MHTKVLIACFAGCLLSVGAPLFIANQMKLGSYAKSPQTVELNLGTSALVGGGRAKLWFGAVDMGARIEVSCKKDSRGFELAPEVESDEVCGVRVRLIEILERKIGDREMLRGKFEVTWDDRSKGSR